MVWAAIAMLILSTKVDQKSLEKEDFLSRKAIKSTVSSYI